MRCKKVRVEPKDIEEIKKWIKKGYTTSDIAEITGWSRKTVNRVRNGELPKKKPVKLETPEKARLPKHVDHSSDNVSGKLDVIIDQLNTLIKIWSK